MRAPIKLNSQTWFSKIFKFIPKSFPPIYIFQEENAELYTKSLSIFKFGTTFKTTEKSRHTLTNRYILDLLNKDSIICDVGASNGITSLDLISQLNFDFKKYFVTDYNLEVYFNQNKASFYFFDENGNCILIYNGLFIFYPQDSKFIKWVFKSSILRQNGRTKKPLKLILPELLQMSYANSKIVIQKYNIFLKWEEDKLDLVKAANIFNRAYFSDEEILKGINNIKEALNEQGYMVIIDNKEIERASIFKIKGDHLSLIHSINNGADIQQLVCNKYCN